MPDKLFLDAGPVFIATAQIRGDSATLFRLADKNKVTLITSKTALIEAKINVAAHLKEKDLGRFFIVASLFTAIDKITLSRKAVETHKALLPLNARKILASALRMKADYLITLDNAFFNRKLLDQDFGISIMTPDSYLKHFTEKKQETLPGLF